MTCANCYDSPIPGPCTLVATCPCGGVIVELRPPGHTYGLHAPDCAGAERHYGPCPSGGSGHPVGVVHGSLGMDWAAA